MASLKRNQTSKVGVFYLLGKARVKNRLTEEEKALQDNVIKYDKIFYIMYRKDGKKIEEKVGRESESMTTAKAAKIREQRINGLTLSNTERRERRNIAIQKENSRWTIDKLWSVYKENKPNLKGIVTDENRYKNYLKQFYLLTPEEINTQMIDKLRLDLTKQGKKAGTIKNILLMCQLNCRQIQYDF